MKIKQLHIYGFGKWQDQTWDLDVDNMTMITGNNETGKSTIRAFILFMLFGLPPQQRERYLPKRGGQLGGRIIVQASDGADYTIERLHDRFKGEAVCYDQAGQEQASDWLVEELNGMDRSLYNQIFNFDVFSLQIDGGVSEEKLGEVLLSVGMTGSDRIYQAEKELNKVLDTQFKRQGSKPELNQLINKLVKQDRELKQLEDSVEAYQDHQQKSQAYQAEIEAKRTKITELNQKLSLFSEQERVYPSIETYHLLEQNLAEFPDSIDFPEQGEERFREAKAKLQPLQSDRELAKRQVIHLEADLAQLTDRLLPEEKIKQIVARLEHIHIYQEQLNDQKHLERQIAEKSATMTSQLNELKLNLTEADLVKLPLNYTTSQTWEQLADDYHQTTKQLADSEQSLDLVVERNNRLATDLAILEAKTLSDREKDVAEKELEQLNQRFEHDQAKGNESQKLQSSHRIFSLISLSVMVISLILMLINSNPLMKGLLLGLILIVGSLYLWQQVKFNRSWLALFNEQTEDETAIQTERRDELVKKLTLHDANRDQLMLSQDQFKKNEAEQATISEQINQLTLARDKTEQMIEQEREQFSFLDQLSVSFWPDLAKRLLTIIDLDDQRNQFKNQLTEREIKVNQFEMETTAEFADLFDQDNKTFQEQLTELKEISIQQQHDLEQQEKLRGRLTEQHQTVEQLEAKMIPYQAEVAELLKRADVASEEQFISQARRYQTWDELKDKQREMRRQIQLHLPDSMTAGILAGEFLTKNELELKIKSINQQLAELGEQLNELIQKEADQQAILKSLAHSKETVNLKHAFHFTEDKLNEAAREWLVNQIALQQIGRTKAVFQTSYLPVVLERATEYFSKLTDQRYHQVDFDQNSQQLFLLASDQQTYQLEELSQGTLDQLFVSIRLAISTWLAEHIHLPFLIDDGFVHFDAVRKEQVFEILEKLSEVHQMIYFSKERENLGQKNYQLINLA